MLPQWRSAALVLDEGFVEFHPQGAVGHRFALAGLVSPFEPWRLMMVSKLFSAESGPRFKSLGSMRTARKRSLERPSGMRMRRPERIRTRTASQWMGQQS